MLEEVRKKELLELMENDLKKGYSYCCEKKIAVGNETDLTFSDLMTDEICNNIKSEAIQGEGLSYTEGMLRLYGHTSPKLRKSRINTNIEEANEFIELIYTTIVNYGERYNLEDFRDILQRRGFEDSINALNFLPDGEIILEALELIQSDCETLYLVEKNNKFENLCNNLIKNYERVLNAILLDGKESIPEPIESLIELNKVEVNGDGTFRVVKSLADVIDYYLDSGCSITNQYIRQYFRQKDKSFYTERTIESTLSKRRELKNKPFL